MEGNKFLATKFEGKINQIFTHIFKIFDQLSPEVVLLSHIVSNAPGEDWPSEDDSVLQPRKRRATVGVRLGPPAPTSAPMSLQIVCPDCPGWLSVWNADTLPPTRSVSANQKFIQATNAVCFSAICLDLRNRWVTQQIGGGVIAVIDPKFAEPVPPPKVPHPQMPPTNGSL